MNYTQDATDAINDEIGHRLEPGQAELYALSPWTGGEETTESDAHNTWGTWPVTSLPNHPARDPWGQPEYHTIPRDKHRTRLVAIHQAARGLHEPEVV